MYNIQQVQKLVKIVQFQTIRPDNVENQRGSSVKQLKQHGSLPKQLKTT